MDSKTVRELSGGDAQMILPGLYLGSSKSANSKTFMTGASISHVVTVLPGTKPPFPALASYLLVEVADNKDSDLYCLFGTTNVFIDEGRRQGGVLVHCNLGQSRSPAVLVAYLMGAVKMTLRDAMENVSRRRAGVKINQGFVEQLELYSRMGSPFTGDRPQGIERKAKLLASLFEKKLVKTPTPGFLAPDLSAPGRLLLIPKGSTSNKPLRVGLHLSSSFSVCKDCKRFLFTVGSIVGHGNSSHAEESSRKAKSKSEKSKKSRDKEEVAIQRNPASTPESYNSVFIEPQLWMQKYKFTKSEGDIVCPGCKALLGEWSWAGIATEAQQFKPAFRINTNSILAGRQNLPIFAKKAPESQAD